MMNIKGPFDMLLLYHWILSEIIDRHAFTALALSNILLTAMVTPWIDIFYNPHKRLSAATGRNTTSFLNTPRNVELRVLCCIETEENVPSIISLLEALNPTKANTVCAYVVHLNELVGLAPPAMLPYYRKMRRMASKGSSSIMRAFENYSRNSLGVVSVRPYTVVAPYKSMHEYICRLALQEVIPLVIIPYQANQHTNTMEVTTMKIINSNVQTYSPCTIGVLVDKGIHLSHGSSLSLSAAVLFVSGNDDHEALAFGIRMTGRPNVRVTVIRIIVTHQEDKSDEDRAEKEADDLLINQFLHEKGKIETDTYQEISAENAGDVMQKLLGVDLSYDLIIVGRKRKNSLLAEDMMRDWSENPELGVLGDLISSDHFQASVLVMQHSGDINVPSQSESNESEGEHLLRTNS
ncbi:hypothetical protein MLD38_008788 [Melastoma candidum]|nr:hypothetical protein MLD38_008788 [Melastoma candidum]